MNCRYCLLFTGVLILLCVSQAEARDYYVDAVNGDNIDGDGSQGYPYRHITVAIRQVEMQAGDIIHLAPGTYTDEPDEFGFREDFPIDLSLGISLIGTEATDVIIEAKNTSNTVIYITGNPNPINISNLTIKHFTQQGYGILAKSSQKEITIEYCSIVNNGIGIVIDDAKAIINRNSIRENFNQGEGTFGAGICSNIATVTITENTIEENRTKKSSYGYGGGGIYLYASDALIAGNRIINNSAEGNGGGIYGNGTYVLINNLIAGNTSDRAGGGLLADRHSTLIGCSLIGNTAERGTIAVEGPNCTIANCVIAGAVDNEGNSSSAIYEIDENSDPHVMFNLFWDNAEQFYIDEGNYGIPHPKTMNIMLKEAWENISEDPEFINADKGNYDLQPNSACIDAGTDVVPGIVMPITDILGRNRPQGKGYDIGAYEFQGEKPTPTIPPTPIPTPISSPTVEPPFPFEIVITPDEIDFGEVTIGEFRELVFLLENPGEGGWSVEPWTLAPFSIVEGLGADISPGGSVMVIVRYEPQVAGTDEEIVNFNFGRLPLGIPPHHGDYFESKTVRGTAVLAPIPTSLPTIPPPTAPTIPPSGPVVFEFDQPSLEDNGWFFIPGGFSTQPGGEVSFVELTDWIPSSSDGRGMMMTVDPGEVAFVMTTFPVHMRGRAAILRAVVRADHPDVSVALAVLKGDYFSGENMDSSIATHIPATAASFIERERTLVLLYEPDSGETITPVLQIAATGDTSSSRVYFDRLEIHFIEEGTEIPSELLLSSP